MSTLLFRHFQWNLKIYLNEKRYCAIDNDVYLIERTLDRPDIKVLIADIYIAGEGDIIEISYDYTDIDCIVLVGFYNRYSGAAKEFARERKIGLYDNREFFGAVNCTGNAFLNYVRKSK